MAQNRILLDHGSGGRLSHELVERLMLGRFRHPALARLDDSACLEINSPRLAFTTDSYTVEPIFFPGGDIGRLAVCGTVNDLAMSGARPLYLSLGLIIEEGLAFADLETILDSAAAAADEANVAIVTGDTKVVPKGAADRIFINTSGVGELAQDVDISGARARPGDVIILSGTMADHGVTILSSRHGLDLGPGLVSDVAPLNHLVAAMLATGQTVHTLRDPTRGGVATTLNEIACQSRVGLIIDESVVPVCDEVRGACEILGLDPFYLANEGKLLAFAPEAGARELLHAMRGRPEGKYAAVIGRVEADHPGRVALTTAVGGSRIMDMLAGEPLPRIC